MGPDVDQDGSGLFVRRQQRAQRVVVERAEAVRVDLDRKVRREQHHASIRFRVLDVFDRNARRVGSANYAAPATFLSGSRNILTISSAGLAWLNK